MSDKTLVAGETGVQAIRRRIIGVDELVPLFNGTSRPYINFDNAASTPALREAFEAINNFMPWYSSVHRGSGFKSQIASQAYDDARRIVGDFFGANTLEHTVIFGKNTTEAINKLSYRLGLTKKDVVLVGLSEHHSNDLPWRKQAKVVHIKIDAEGNLLESDLQQLLNKYSGRVKLVALCGGSNVTGAISDIHSFARLSHAAGAKFFVDCAQLAAHRQIDIRPLADQGHLDFIAVSAHKIYAPFGTGALIGRRDTFETGSPEACGGGTIKVVTENDVQWAPPPEKDEAGSPNVVGAVAFAAALKVLSELGMENIAAREAELTAYALNKLRQNKTITIYGSPEPAEASRRLGVISINIGGMHHSLVAAILSAEWGIGVRSGCFCAHPYVTHLLGITGAKLKVFASQMMNNDRSRSPGMVRVSFGLYNTKQEVDILAKALEQIAAGAYDGVYDQDKQTGEYSPRGWQPNIKQSFSL